MKLSSDLVAFLQKQGFAIVSTLDVNRKIHCSAKGIIGLEKKGTVYLIDLYRAKTFNNLKRDPTVSLTVIDEHQFKGYTLKGEAFIVEREKINGQIMKKWEETVVKRISQRLVKSVKRDKRSSLHPEARFPRPQYLIEVKVEEIVDLAPHSLRD